MTALSAPVVAAALEAYDFSGIGLLVDVAGGHGEVLMSILKKHPNVRGVLTDVGHVIDGAKPRIASAGLADRCQAVPCDFFAAVPEGGDAYIMKHIIHDWDDARATTILKNIAKAMGAKRGKVILLESVIAAGRRARPRQVHRHRDAGDAGRQRAERRRVPRAVCRRRVRADADRAHEVAVVGRRSRPYVASGFSRTSRRGMTVTRRLLIVACAVSGRAWRPRTTGFAQSSPSAEWAAHAANQYQVFPNITYLTASNYEAKMDIYARRGATTPQRTVIYFHGGFWAAGSKDASLMSLMPWLEMGWTVVNVEYRLARVALAPAAVEDCLCALRFIAAQAKTYNIDTARIVLTGESAGGHLTLTTGMIPESSGLARQCAGATPIPRVAAMINWFGITDVADVIDGPHAANLAVTWLGSLPNKDEIAKRVSPLTWVQARPPADPDDPRRHGSARALRRGGPPARRARPRPASPTSC